MTIQKISTLGYFTKRLKDNGFVVWKMFNKYSMGDHRRWTVLINPGYHSLYITCSINEEELDYMPNFHFYDGGWFMKNKQSSLATKSMEVIITFLLDNNITPDSTLYKKELNDTPVE
jgi:hypothetical protein